MIAVGQLGGGERQPDPHLLFTLDSDPGGKAGAGDGGQHIGVGMGDAQLQIGAGRAPLSEQLARPIPNAGAGVGAPAIDADPELNHGALPAHFEHSGRSAS